MVSSFGRGFDSLQLHYVSPSRGLTLVRVFSVATLCESGKAERDSLQLHYVSPSRAYPREVFIIQAKKIPSRSGGVWGGLIQRFLNKLLKLFTSQTLLYDGALAVKDGHEGNGIHLERQCDGSLPSQQV